MYVVMSNIFLTLLQIKFLYMYVQGKVDTKNQHPPQYSVVDKSKKTKKKDDKPKKVASYVVHIELYTYLHCTTVWEKKFRGHCKKVAYHGTHSACVCSYIHIRILVLHSHTMHIT